MLSARLKFSGNSAKNCTFQAFYTGEKGTVCILPLEKAGSPKHLRIDTVTYTISEGCEVFLRWDKGEAFLVLSGRGFLKFEGGISPESEEVEMLLAELKAPGTVCLFIDAEKQ